MKKRFLIGCLAGVLLLAASGWCSLRLLHSRGGGARADATTGGGTPVLQFVNVALGGFRGVIADLLWLRAESLQEEGRFVELVQLSEWIAALEPDNGEVWAYHGWNLSFNVCAMQTRIEDRWRWVEAGIRLLEFRGVRLNPKDARTRRELAWTLQFKLGTDVDRAAGYYRREWARGLGKYLGPAGVPPAPGSDAATELAKEYGLDARKMAEIDARFGAFDWRVPGASAVYWALEGVERAAEKDLLACRRLVYQSLVQMVQNSGRIAGNPDAKNYMGEVTPNVGLLDGTLSYFRETARGHRFHGVRAAWIGLLFDAVRIEARRGNAAKALERYTEIVGFFEPDAKLPAYDEAVTGTFRFDTLPWGDLKEDWK